MRQQREYHQHDGELMAYPDVDGFRCVCHCQSELTQPRCHARVLMAFVMLMLVAIVFRVLMVQRHDPRCDANAYCIVEQSPGHNPSAATH